MYVEGIIEYQKSGIQPRNFDRALLDRKHGLCASKNDLGQVGVALGVTIPVVAVSCLRLRRFPWSLRRFLWSLRRFLASLKFKYATPFAKIVVREQDPVTLLLILILHRTIL
jgi:hypothetical protein